MYFPFLNALGTGNCEPQIHLVLDLNIFGVFMKLIFMFKIMLESVSLVMYAAGRKGVLSMLSLKYFSVQNICLDVLGFVFCVTI